MALNSGQQVFACLSVVGVFVTIVLIVIYHSNKQGLEIARRWCLESKWTSTTCNVLAVGVTCTEKDTGSTCGGFGISNGTREVGGVTVFDYNEIASCPGSRWCAKEGDPCECHGIVTYATEMFNGRWYTHEHTDAIFTQRVSGVVKCGLDSDGVPYVDPAPFWVKHCWCTPDNILRDLKRKESEVNDPAACAETGNAEWNRGVDDEADKVPSDGLPRGLAYGPAAVQEPEHQQQERNHAETLAISSHSSTQEAILSHNIFEGGGKVEEEDEGLDDYDDEPLSDASPRELTSHSSPRRRRTYAYTPWALVEVPPEEDDGFGDEEDTKSTITCAYEFGTPEISYGQYETNGPNPWFFNHAKDAQHLVESWAQETRTCFVRALGSSSFDSCAVAMEPLEKLRTMKESNMNFVWGLLVSSIIVTMGFLSGLIYNSIHRSGYDALRSA